MLLSLITVTYNAFSSLEQTILSVKQQQYKGIEYIVIDGGSSDGTLKMLRKYPDVVTLIVSEPDEGIYDAMNKGLRKA